MKKRLVLLTAVLAMALGFSTTAYAATFDHGGWSVTTKLTSSEKAPHEYVEVSASGSKLIIKGETTLPSDELSFSAQTIKPGSSKLGSVWMGRAYPVDEGSYYSFSATIDVMSLKYSKLPALYKNQNYVLYIKNNGKTFYRNAHFNVDSNGKVRIIEWDKVIAQNKAQRDADIDPSECLDPTLSEYVGMKEIQSLGMTSAQAKYVKDVSDDVVGNASGDVLKAQRIHDYIATNIYYDVLGNSGGSTQYYNPYETLYNMLNKVKAPNSDGKGKVATTCVGDAGLTIAMARAQGIPARLCNGHHLRQAVPYDNWNSEADVSKIDHWWAELYIDGQWYVVDPVPSTSNRWKRESSSDVGTWEYSGLSNRNSFMPTIEQLSATHVTYNVYGGGKNSNDTSVLRTPKVKASNIASTGKIRVSWNKVPGAAKYELWRSNTGKTGTWSKVLTTTSTAVTHSSATPGKYYFYKVRAVGVSAAASAYSSGVQRTCDYAQPKVSVSLNSAGKPRISWGTVSGAKRYELWRSTSGKTGTWTKATTTTARSITHSSAEKGVTYYYKVRAVGISAAASAYSSAVSKRV